MDCQVSERNTWPKVEMIRSHCAVEMALEQCVQALRRQLTAENQVPLCIYSYSRSNLNKEALCMYEYLGYRV